MFGTIFRMRPKQGQQQAVINLFEEFQRERGPKVPGALAGYVLRPVNAPDQLIGIAVFQDEKTYDANADDPAQAQWYERLKALLEADPEWEDGEIPGGGSFS